MLLKLDICPVLVLVVFFVGFQCYNALREREGQEEEIGNFVNPKVRTFLCIMIMCKEIYAHMFF